MAKDLEIAIDEFVPDSVKRDIRRVASELRTKGATHLMVQVPVEELAGALNQTCSKLAVVPLVPFIPTICGLPCAPHTGSFVGVIGRPDPQQRAPVLFGADGREYPVTET